MLLTGDRFEPDDTLATAANIGVAPGIHLSNLSISTGDVDWYKFTLLHADSITVSSTFTSSLGYLSLQLTNGSGGQLASGVLGGEGDTLTVNNLAAGTYFINVAGVGGATNNYGLAVDPASGSTTTVYYVNSPSSDGDYYTTAPGNDANSGTAPDAPMATVEGVLSKYSTSIGPDSLILVDTGTYSNSATILGIEEGATYAGSPGGSAFSDQSTSFYIDQADYNTFYGFTFNNDGTGLYLLGNGGPGGQTGHNLFLNNTFKVHPTKA